jgi:DNA-binding XRE family transcriptional regulator
MSEKPHIRKQRKDAAMGSLEAAVNLGAEIRVARLKAGMTQEGLALVVGVGRSAIVDIEKGSPGTAIGTLIRILDALGKRIQVADR